MDLWFHPVEVPRFLVTLPALRSLPLQDLPLHLPPPEPPP
jgi:hypothetical protein